MHYWYGALNAAFPVDRAWPLAAKLPPFLTKARALAAYANMLAPHAAGWLGRQT